MTRDPEVARAAARQAVAEATQAKSLVASTGGGVANSGGEVVQKAIGLNTKLTTAVPPEDQVFPEEVIGIGTHTIII